MGDIPQALSYMEQAFASTTMLGHTQHLNEDIARLKQKLNPDAHDETSETV